MPDASGGFDPRTPRRPQRRARRRGGAGGVRYLRPAYQNPDGVRQETLVMEDGTGKVTAKKVTRQPWPDALPERIQAVQRALGAEDRPATPAALARRFHRALRGLKRPAEKTRRVLKTRRV